MGMSHNPVPAEGYVSVISYDPSAYTRGAHQPPTMQVQPHALVHTQFSQYAAAMPPPPPHDQPQTLLFVTPAADQVAKQQPLLVVADLNSAPQANILLPTASVIQVPLPGLQLQPSGDTVIIADPSPPAINLVQQPAAPVNYQMQMPANTLLLNSNVILCVQPDPADTTTYQLTTDAVAAATTLNCLPEQPLDDSITQTLAAKAWYNDSELANRALTALSRQPQPALAVSHADHHYTSLSVTHYHT